MSTKKILITQSNYIPWKGYFDNIAQCDVFVVYDDMQYTRRDWRNRNYIKTPQGLKWLTIPVEVKGKFHQKINETLISEPGWNLNHWQQLKANYAKASAFKEHAEWVEALYKSAEFSNLTEVNLHFLKAICQFLGIKTEFRDSREFTLAENRTERMVNICQELGATSYLTGPVAKEYMDEQAFELAGVAVEYADYSGYPEYPQLYPPFEHGVCIWDLVFNVQDSLASYLKYCNH